MASYENKKNDVEVDLKNWLSNTQKVVIAGIGNPFRKDDFVGIEIVRSNGRIEEDRSKIDSSSVKDSSMNDVDLLHTCFKLELGRI